MNVENADPQNQVEFCSLGSGSKGNATIIRFKDTILMVDCGFSQKEVLKRLEEKALDVCNITAILVTHEHSDHFSGVAGLSNRYSIPVYCNKGTSLHQKSKPLNEIQYFDGHESFYVGDIKISPVAVPHDSREATQFVFEANGQKIGLLTDVGHITPFIYQKYASCNVLLLEFNYDHSMLLEGKYPQKLKQRVSGSYGHLSNDQSIEFLENLDLSKCKSLVAMHKSEENNSKSKITESFLGCEKLKNVSTDIADQLLGFSWKKI